MNVNISIGNCFSSSISILSLSIDEAFVELPSVLHVEAASTHGVDCVWRNVGFAATACTKVQQSTA